MYAPIVLFAFNRLEPLKACVSSMLMNAEAKETDLIVFVDGPREDKEGEVDKVEAVRSFVKTITGFKSLEYHFSSKNKKLGPSIIAGVSDVIKRYERVIVIEDDLIASRNLLSFMNQALDRYEKNSDIFSISGYSHKLCFPAEYSYDVYFAPRSSSWGWATWKDRWLSCDWELKDWASVEKTAKAFNRWGGSDCYGMLKGWKEGRNQSWAIRFCYNQFLKKSFTLFPIISRINNKGFDGSGTNCKSFSVFKFEFDETDNKCFKMPDSIVIDKRIIHERKKYNSLWMRLYSRLVNTLYKL